MYMIEGGRSCVGVTCVTVCCVREEVWGEGSKDLFFLELSLQPLCSVPSLFSIYSQSLCMYTIISVYCVKSL